MSIETLIKINPSKNDVVIDEAAMTMSSSLNLSKIKHLRPLAEFVQKELESGNYINVSSLNIVKEFNLTDKFNEVNGKDYLTKVNTLIECINEEELTNSLILVMLPFYEVMEFEAGLKLIITDLTIKNDKLRFSIAVTSYTEEEAQTLQNLEKVRADKWAKRRELLKTREDKVQDIVVDYLLSTVDGETATTKDIKAYLDKDLDANNAIKQLIGLFNAACIQLRKDK